MASAQLGGFSKASSRTPVRRHKKLPGTPFFQVDPVVSLDRLENPKPKAPRRARRPTTALKENRSSSNSMKKEFTIGETISATESGRKKFSSNARTEDVPVSSTLGESSVSFAIEGETIQEFISNVDFNDESMIGKTIIYATMDEADMDDEFQTGLSVTHSTTLERELYVDTAKTIEPESYLDYSSSMVQYPAQTKISEDVAPLHDIPVPERYPAKAPSTVENDLMEPLLTSTETDREMDDDRLGNSWRQWLFCLWCWPVQ
jgi:hypothetical protein